MYLFISTFMFISGLIVFSSKRKHLLLMLLSLEFIVLSLYFLIFIYLFNMNYEYYFSMIFLTMSVCEGVLGLSILVMMIRTHGNDYILTFSSLW
uniref:NADH-ubiquinone oxidoreductase chain 4L n=1 Tax=Arhopalus unicolor TaxID=1191617 RepID=A0A7S6XYL5_9CUCU|nr:NADH dehydrogenase subunit 4L [Arhopalus unicolor]YP_010363586.1 NADH dehydrogenase subunit 4L [Cephalallus oberthueri]QOW83734.1 NADH dehydrogenase subunit 4L [Arhopalus unicolor]UNZ12700.1 NADH dehydrogenase subunit 4L [Cephalallus oberthueri]